MSARVGVMIDGSEDNRAGEQNSLVVGELKGRVGSLVELLLDFRWNWGENSKDDGCWVVGRMVVLNGLVSKSSSSSLPKEIPSPLSLETILNGLSNVSIRSSCFCVECT